MKRGRDDEKMVPPMFPRLRVNDTEKVWPRAPPRNKMALYEQFTISSQRYNHGSSSQENGNRRNLQFPVQVPNSAPIHIPEKFHKHQPDVTSISTYSSRHDPKIRIGDQDDFAVHVLDNNPGMAHSRSSSSSSDTKEQADNARGMDSDQNGSCELSGSSEGGSCLLQESINGFFQDGQTGRDVETLRDNDEGTSLRIRRERSIVVHDDDDVASETSMVDSVGGPDICPDDVVGLIGQKCFWKARKAITKQQRVFQLQVFDLHRLIKVQKLIAESPHLLLEDSAYLGKSSPAKRFLPSGFVVKPLPRSVERKDELEKVNFNVEGSAESTLRRPSPLALRKNGISRLNYEPFPAYAPCLGNQLAQGKPIYPGNPIPISPLAMDPKMGSWLIPVMSPSEGLIYKPYQAPPRFMGTSVSGGCGPFGNFASPAYGFHPVNHHYSPPYGKPVTSPVFPSQPMHQSSLGHGSDLSGAEAASNTQAPSLSNLPTQKNGNAPQVMSSSSSTGERVKGDANASQPRDELILFPLTPVSPDEGNKETGDVDPTTRVIRVVPLNARLATASVARIFHSLEEERRQ